jgi:hypothetical protein
VEVLRLRSIRIMTFDRGRTLLGSRQHSHRREKFSACDSNDLQGD